MATFIIEGGHSLKGEITPQGAKNEALQIVCATLLSEETVIVKNIPEIRDVLHLIDIVQLLGVEVNKIEKGVYSFCAKHVNPELLKSEEYTKLASSLRGSVMILGPMLARFGVGFIPQPGGDKIGRRRLDTHFQGFLKLGAEFNFNPTTKFYEVSATHMKGAYMLLDEASVTGTANIIMAAVLTPGTTTIYNAACEPYIQQLCQMLVSNGCKNFRKLDQIC